MLQEAMNNLFKLYRLRDEGKNVQVQIVIAEDLLRDLVILEKMTKDNENEKDD